MKPKRLVPLILSLALTLSLTVAPTHALVFSDVTEDFWGYEDIVKMSGQGYAKGYDDGTFKPNGRMTAAETLLFCARATGVDPAVQARIAEARKEEMTQTLPTANNMNSWAATEMAVAVETGVLSLSELEALSQTDPKSVKVNEKGEQESRTYLEETMPRENICMYLVRAMQLEPLARGLSSYTLSYADREEVAPSLQPYVFVLTQYGIVKGKNGGNFDPKGPVTRAEMTTMLSRALTFMSEKGIVTELSEYTAYDWKSGMISGVTVAADGSLLLTLNSELSGTQTFAVPSAAKIYHDNMLAPSTTLKTGQYARLNFSKNGTVQEVRLGGTAIVYSGAISDLTGSRLTVLIDGAARSLTIDRFTEVAVGKTVGDRSLIDEEAGYTAASCTVDEMGHLAAVRFSGGTQLVTGLVKGVATVGGSTTLSLSAFNGVVYHYPIPLGIPVTVNGSLGSLSTAHTGKYVQLRVGTESGQVSGVTVDTVSSFVQGPIKRLGTVGTARSIYIADVFSGKEVSPTISQSAAVTYDGEARTIPQIEPGWYVTAMLTGGMIVRMDAFPGSSTVEGTLTAISYGSPLTAIQITQENDSVVSYNLDIARLPSIVRSGKTGSITDLITGDKVVVTIRYNEVEKIEATPRSADLTGVIEEISMTSAGVTTMQVKLSDGSVASYTVFEGVPVTQDGKTANLYALKPGFSIALVTKGEQVVSIEITSAAASSTELTGKVFLVNSGSRTISLQIADSKPPVNLDVRDATLLSVTNPSLKLSLGDLKTGDSIRAFGAYNGSTFVATIVIRQ